MKRFVSVLSALIAICITFSGCSSPITKDTAHTTVSQFFSELVDEDASGAMALMYPALEVQSAGFRNYVADVEKKCGISFADGRSNMRVGISEWLSDTEYRVGGEVNIGEVRISFEAVVRQDGGGTGIFRITIGGVAF